MSHFGAEKAYLKKFILIDCKKSSVIENQCLESLNASFKQQNGGFKAATTQDFSISFN